MSPSEIVLLEKNAENREFDPRRGTWLTGAAIPVRKASSTGRLSSYSHKSNVEWLRGRVSVLREIKVTFKASNSTANRGVSVADSEQTVAEWLTYLPKDCVKAMIERGWHITTR